jgi:3-oxoacyl-[acyl-carrier protein] reductase
MRKVALVTGATRGIGKACALSLARQGYDVVVTGRTVKEGEGRVLMPYAKDGKETSVPVPGSLETTVRAVEALGREVMPITMDLLDRGSLDRLVKQTLDSWGRIDVLVNNAIYQGAGTMSPFAEFTFDQFYKIVLGDLVNQAYLTRLVLPGMIAQGSGVIVNLTSNAGIYRPKLTPDKGGWGFVYGSAKSGFHRIAEFVHLEHAKNGIIAFNVEPGFTVTEVLTTLFGPTAGTDYGRAGVMPDVTGNVVAWLATQPEARELSGTLISSPTFFKTRGITFP